jgi:hypothetical protein
MAQAASPQKTVMCPLRTYLYRRGSDFLKVFLNFLRPARRSAFRRSEPKRRLLSALPLGLLLYVAVTFLFEGKF